VSEKVEECLLGWKWFIIILGEGFFYASVPKDENRLCRQTYSDTEFRVAYYQGVSKSFRTESITKYTLTTINTR
jgi:hypothetical protein